ncbi:MAG: hypothetical protein WD356_02860 [Pseudomonadales bacterium]
MMMFRAGVIVLLTTILSGVSLPAPSADQSEKSHDDRHHDREAASRVIARTCVTCHHPDNRDIPAVPGDMDRQALAARLNALREPDETVTVMHRLMAGIDEEDIPALARVLTERP